MDEFEQPAEIEAINAYIDALLAGEKPAAGRISQEKADMLRMATLLDSAGAGVARPRVDLAVLRQASLAARARHAWWELRPTRRGLLGGASAAIALFLAGAFGDQAFRRFRVPGPGPRWVPVAKAADLASGTAKRFLAGDVDGYLLNLGGSFSALSAICTHQPCVLNWTPAEGVFECPCHGAEFLPSGAQSPADDYGLRLPPLARFAVQQADGWLYVRV